MSDELAHLIRVLHRAQIAQREREDFMVLVASDDVLLAEVNSNREVSPWRTLFSEYQFMRGELRVARAEIALLKVSKVVPLSRVPHNVVRNEVAS